MSHVINITFSDEVYSRLIKSSEKMSLTKSGYVSYALRQMFNAEDNMVQIPVMLNQMKILTILLDDRIEKLKDMRALKI